MHSDEDYMELGESGLVPIEDGWFLDKNTGRKIDWEGREFDPNTGEMLFDPNDSEDE